MKFEYVHNSGERECVAYIDGEYLILKVDELRAVALSYHGVGTNAKWNPDAATQKFYKGDQVTITF